MGFVHFWVDRRQDPERQTSCEEKAVLSIAYTTSWNSIFFVEHSLYDF